MDNMDNMNEILTCVEDARQCIEEASCLLSELPSGVPPDLLQEAAEIADVCEEHAHRLALWVTALRRMEESEED